MFGIDSHTHTHTNIKISVKYSLQIKWFLNRQRLSTKISPGDANRVQDTLRNLPLRGSYWVQLAADQKNSMGLPWYCCL